jgi:hypothetical protein
MQAPDDKAPKPVRKPYEPPQLVEYGRIEKLTKGSAGPNADHGTFQN